MKARVKATGEIKEVELNQIGGTPVYMDKDGVIYNGLYDLDFDVEEKSLPKNEPDYWEKLKHQYAGMAMQGMVKTYEQMMRSDIECKMDCCEYVDAEVANGVLRSHAEACAEFCAEFATALVNKLKEEEK